MTYARVKDYIPTSMYSLKAKYPMKPEYITIHNTANDATARNEVAYLKRNTASTGYHVAIDDKEAIEVIPFNRNAWHAGDGNGNGNRRSIGIEICYSKSGGERYKKAEANTIEYVAQLLKEYGWGIDRVKWHRDWSGKNCPHRILNEGRGDAVRKAIADRLAELNREVKSASTDKPSKEEVRMFKPTSKTLKDEMVAALEMAHKKGILTSGKWAKQAEQGKLPLDDAIALVATLVRRTNVDK